MRIMALFVLGLVLFTGCKPVGSVPDSNVTDDLVSETPTTIDEATSSAGESTVAESTSTPEAIAKEPAASEEPIADAVAEVESDGSGESTGDTAAGESVAEADAGGTADTTTVSTKVLLGAPELTAGIPGDGPLKDAEIRAWLDNPANHIPLEVELPVGLSAGKALVQGIQENPMTRAKIELGRQLYFDTRLSSDNTISCASCHHPDEGYGKHEPFGVGVQGQTGDRNSPISYNRILSGAQFWDGRADSLEAQAVGPIANPIEMGFTHEGCVECLGEIAGYKMQFEKIFPEEGLTIDNVGKAIATFERAIVTEPAPYDYYETVRNVETQLEEDEIADLEEDDPEMYARYTEAIERSAPMSDSARNGRELFFSEKSNCTACHAGANFSDEKYHNLGVGMDKENPDLGRFKVTEDEKDKGAFKTPTLRNVALSAPYMHDGSQATLEEVVEWYAKGGHPNPWLSDKIEKLDLTEQEKKDLVAFMKEGLTSPFPQVETGRLPQ